MISSNLNVNQVEETHEENKDDMKYELSVKSSRGWKLFDVKLTYDRNTSKLKFQTTLWDTVKLLYTDEEEYTDIEEVKVDKTITLQKHGYNLRRREKVSKYFRITQSTPYHTRHSETLQ